MASTLSPLSGSTAAMPSHRAQPASPTFPELSATAHAPPTSTSSFYPDMPRVSTEKPEDLATFVRMLNGTAATRFILDGHAQCCVSLVHWYVAPRDKMACLTLNRIEVEQSHRRQGHARRCLKALCLAAGANRLGFVIYNVVSAHMHTLMSEFGGRCLPSTIRRGLDGCSYLFPPDASAGAAPLHLVDVQRFASSYLPPFRLGLEAQLFQLCLCGCPGCVVGTCTS